MRPVESKRIALHRKIALRFPDFEGFVTEYASNLSMTGMFVRTDEPHEPGTPVRFEFSLKDGARLIRGSGWVVWSRAKKEGRARPAGMGIEFTEIDRESRRLIRWLILNQLPEGDAPFDVAAGTASEPVTRYGTMRIDTRRTVWSGVLAGVGFFAVLGGLLYWGLGGREPAATLRAGDPSSPEAGLPPSGQTAQSPGGEAGRAVAARAPAAAPSPPSAGSTADRPREPSSPAAPVSGLATAEAEALVRSWARAWSRQDVDSYLDHYALAFEPEDGVALDDWKAQRRDRVAAPRSIRVAIARLETNLLSEDEARVTFLQTYRSERYSDTVDKVLILGRESGRWKIRRELAD